MGRPCSCRAIAASNGIYNESVMRQVITLQTFISYRSLHDILNAEELQIFPIKGVGKNEETPGISFTYYIRNSPLSIIPLLKNYVDFKLLYMLI